MKRVLIHKDVERLFLESDRGINGSGHGISGLGYGVSGSDHGISGSGDGSRVSTPSTPGLFPSMNGFRWVGQRDE